MLYINNNLFNWFSSLRKKHVLLGVFFTSFWEVIWYFEAIFPLCFHIKYICVCMHAWKLFNLQIKCTILAAAWTVMVMFNFQWNLFHAFKSGGDIWCPPPSNFLSCPMKTIINNAMKLLRFSFYDILDKKHISSTID